MSTLFPDAYPKPYPGVPSGVGTLIPGHQYASSIPASTLLDGLISYWKLDEESGTRYDSVGTNHLTDNNTVGFVAGVNGNAASFVAANGEYLSVSPGGIDWGSGFTISFWCYSADTTFSKDDAGSNREWTLVGDTFYTFQDAGTFSTLGLGVVDSNPHHVLIWFDPADGKTHKLLDGAAQNASVALTGVASTGAPIWIGKFADTIMTGSVDEFAIWSRVLTEDERAELYAAGAGKFYPFT